MPSRLSPPMLTCEQAASAGTRTPRKAQQSVGLLHGQKHSVVPYISGIYKEYLTLNKMTALFFFFFNEQKAWPHSSTESVYRWLTSLRKTCWGLVIRERQTETAAQHRPAPLKRKVLAKIQRSWKSHRLLVGSQMHKHHGKRSTSYQQPPTARPVLLLPVIYSELEPYTRTQRLACKCSQKLSRIAKNWS